MPAAVPGYFDYLIEGFWSGSVGRNVHLGYWDEPPSLDTPCFSEEFEAAQARLTDILIGLADLQDSQTVLDIGCGFGGTLEVLGRRPAMRLFGVNIDRRQLDICRTLPMQGSSLSLVLADACALPFRKASFDRVICVEAMFHFASRQTFLHEAAGMLRDGGRLVLSDVLLRNPQEHAPLEAAAIESAIKREYGPWPQLWIGREEVLDLALQAELKPDLVIDATPHTLPTHRVTAPQEHDGLPPDPSAGSALRWLHASGYLSYLCASFTKV